MVLSLKFKCQLKNIQFNKKDNIETCKSNASMIIDEKINLIDPV